MFFSLCGTIFPISSNRTQLSAMTMAAEKCELFILILFIHWHSTIPLSMAIYTRMTLCAHLHFNQIARKSSRKISSKCFSYEYISKILHYTHHLPSKCICIQFKAIFFGYFLSIHQSLFYLLTLIAGEMLSRSAAALTI